MRRAPDTKGTPEPAVAIRFLVLWATAPLASCVLSPSCSYAYFIVFPPIALELDSGHPTLRDKVRPQLRASSAVENHASSQPQLRTCFRGHHPPVARLDSLDLR